MVGSGDPDRPTTCQPVVSLSMSTFLDDLILLYTGYIGDL